MWSALLGILIASAWLTSLFRLRPMYLLKERRQQRAFEPYVRLAGPTVSVVIAARNEAEHITRTLQSLKNQSYTNFEVIVVDDRSTDTTFDELQAIKQNWPTLQVLQIQHLPAGWLGKNHALARGAQIARGEWLLFTDADIFFHPHALTRSLTYAQTYGADHVTASPTLLHQGYWLNALVSLFAFNLMIVFHPHTASDPRSKAAVGVGAFNLLTREAYQAIGTHAAFPMHPDDDLNLGQRIKKAHLKQHFVALEKFIEVEWYPSVRAMMEGLEKNALAPFDFSQVRMLLAVLGAFIFYEGPFVGAILAHGWEKGGYVLALLLMYSLYRFVKGFAPVRLRWFIGFPLVVPLFLYVILRAAVLFAWRRGMVWRGTFYHKDELIRMRHQDH